MRFVRHDCEFATGSANGRSPQAHSPRFARSPQAHSPRFARWPGGAGILPAGAGGTLPAAKLAGRMPAPPRTISTSATTYLHGDLIESTVATTDGSGAAAASTAYSAFGELVTGYSPLATRYGYAGGHGYESGLLSHAGVNPLLAPLTFQHLGHRWYQPDIGRFVQRDPIGLEGGLNLYVYCDNDPISCVDPFGLESVVGGPWWARWLLNGTGGRDSWLDDSTTRGRVQTALAIPAGVAAAAFCAPIYLGYLAGTAVAWGTFRTFGGGTGIAEIDHPLDGVAIGVGIRTVPRCRRGSPKRAVMGGFPGTSNPPYLYP